MCQAGFKCGANGLCPGTCTGDGDCLTDYTCAAGGVCKHKPGKSCGGDGDCSSNECINGTCCLGGCKRTDENCGVGCDNTGACTFSAPGTICAGPGCSGNDMTVSLCNASGGCVAQPNVTCPTSCTGGVCM
jgi:hypothetical protein